MLLPSSEGAEADVQSPERSLSEDAAVIGRVEARKPPQSTRLEETPFC